MLDAPTRITRSPGWSIFDILLWAGLVAAVAASAILAEVSLSRLTLAREDAIRWQTVDSALKDVLAQLLDAESSQRGFLLSGQATYLRGYFVGVNKLRDSRTALKAALAREPDASAQLHQLDQAIDGKLLELAQTVKLKSEGQSAETENLVSTDSGKLLMESARESLAALASGQGRRASVIRLDNDWQLHLTETYLAIALGVSAILFVAVGWRVSRAVFASRAQYRDLARRLAAAEDRTEHVRGLSELNRLLQSCKDIEEAQDLLQSQLPPLLLAQSGALYIMAASRNQLRKVFEWGEVAYGEYFAPGDCWAVRLNQPYHQPGSPGAASCAHFEVNSTETLPTMECLPLVAHGELIGLIALDTGMRTNVENTPPALGNSSYRRIVLEQVALALGNLKLRESLRQQSIRDVLTGLYNRRFLEESVKRELLQAVREHAQGTYKGLAILMIDVDHFKKVNDRFGHEVGDFVLREVTQVLHRETRGGDVAARYGGEEFTVVLVDISGLQAYARAEQLRLQVEKLALQTAGTDIGPVTISIGMAKFPVHGQTIEELLGAADKALYAAKNGGRNRVVTAPEAEMPGTGQGTADRRQVAEPS